MSQSEHADRDDYVPADLKRFAQAARKSVRDYVRHHREPPPLVLLASIGSRPQRLRAYRIGAAQDAAEVRRLAVDAIREEGSHYAAVCAQLRVAEDRGERTTTLGLVVADAFWLLTMACELEQGARGLELGGWQDAAFARDDDYAFVQQALRANVYGKGE